MSGGAENLGSSRQSLCKHSVPTWSHLASCCDVNNSVSCKHELLHKPGIILPICALFELR